MRSAGLAPGAEQPSSTLARRLLYDGARARGRAIRMAVKDVTLDVQYNGTNMDPWGNERIH